MAKVVLLVTTRTRPGKRDEVRRLWEAHLRPRVEANAAQEVYLFCEDSEDPDVFHLVELYASVEAMGVNANSPWFAEYLRAVLPLLDGPSVVRRATPVWAKGAVL